MHLKANKLLRLFLSRQLTRLVPSQPETYDLATWKLASKEEFLEYQRPNFPDLKLAREYENSLIEFAGRQADWFPVKGYCYHCSKNVRFYVDFDYGSIENGRRIPNWREHLRCPSCGLNNRKRAALHLFELLLLPTKTAKIYTTEQTTRLFRQLKKRFPNTVGSEYLGDGILPGQKNRGGIRHEDLTRLTFGSNGVDFILSFDVLEHVFDLEAALRECYRCLKFGGYLFFTVPFHFYENKNVRRASVDEKGEITHLLAPQYHGDPLNKKGILCFHDFGWELLSIMRDMGFEDVHALMYWSREYGYLGENQCIFLARK